MDYKQTLNLPKTDFPMRANLAVREPELLKRWQSEDLYRRLLEKNAQGKRFVLHDGPPYANGNVHLGTALNKIVKDIIVKRHLMAGEYAPYIPGWDCHGMPIEHQVLRELGDQARQLPRLEIRRRCRDFAEKYYKIQREQFQRLGVLGDWDNPYLTMSFGYEAGIIRVFRELVEGGYIYRGLRPVHWCPSCATALAEAEVEYGDHESPSIYVRFAFRGSAAQAASMAADSGDGAWLAQRAAAISAVIWTTTPWTLPANLAVCLNPHLEYVALEVGPDVFLVAARRADEFLAAIGAEAVRRVAVNLIGLDGEDLFRHPFIDRPSRLIFESHVTADAGTGCVHTAPGHGYEDFQVGQKYGLEVLTPVDAAGRFTEQGGQYAGRPVFATNGAIVEELRERGALVKGEVLAHQYPHCWRCKSPLIFRATEQWFLRVDHAELRQRALREIEAVRWVPQWGQDRIRNMMEVRPDWCLSRQRAWGVPIPAFSCDQCGRFHADAAIIAHVEQVFAARGSDAWYELEPRALLPEGYRCECGSASLTPDDNILDVWFDAGCSHHAVLEARGLGVPADLYVEAVDQHRGWFQVSLITAVATNDAAPYRSVLTHGLILDAAKKKMSKSLGNVISPEEIISKYGADILRLLFASVDFTNDTSFSQDLVTPCLESYRRIRNTCRFMLGNLSDFDPACDTVATADLPEIDRWILQRAQRLATRCLAAYDAYACHQVVQALVTFCAVDLSALYMDIAKDRLYCSAAGASGRRAAQTTLLRLLQTLVRLCAPILSYTAEEVWSFLPGGTGGSVFAAGMPELDPALEDEALASRWEQLLRVRAVVTKALEEARQAGQIGNALDARVTLAAGGDTYTLLAEQGRDLEALLIVSQAEVVRGAGDGEVRVTVEAARGEKCGRCWNFRETVGSSAAHPTICDRCAAVLGNAPA